MVRNDLTHCCGETLYGLDRLPGMDRRYTNCFCQAAEAWPANFKRFAFVYFIVLLLAVLCVQMQANLIPVILHGLRVKSSWRIS